MPYYERLFRLNLGYINLSILKSGIAFSSVVAGAYMMATEIVLKIDDKIDATNAKLDASAAEMRTSIAATNAKVDASAAEMRSSVASTNAKLDTLLATLLKVDIHNIYSKSANTSNYRQKIF